MNIFDVNLQICYICIDYINCLIQQIQLYKHFVKKKLLFQGDERKIYEFVVRHFLACCSQDAQGKETIVDMEIANEKVCCSGMIVIIYRQSICN